MNRSGWRWAAGIVASMALLVPAALAWACVGLMSLTTSSPTVQPGGTVTVFGKEFAQGAPVDIHLDSPTGQILATVPAPTDTMTSQFRVDVRIPPTVQTGQHMLVATQTYHYMNTGAPARAVIYVGMSAPPPPAPAARAADLTFDKGPSAASLVLIGLGVAAIGLLAAGFWSLMASRRNQEPQAARVS